MDNTLDYYQLFKTSFATRLISKLREKGYISRCGYNTANGVPLAKATGLSLAMVRKYLNAKSIPPNATLYKISNWLDVDPHWLLYGTNAEYNAPSALEFNLFKEIFAQFYPLLCNSNLNKQQYMSFILGAYDIYNRVFPIEGEKRKAQAISLMINFLTQNLKNFTKTN